MNPDLPYAAGLFDGEGSIVAYERKTATSTSGRTTPHQIRVTVTNTHEGIVRWLAERFSGSVCAYAARGRRRPAWKWTAQCKTAAAFLKDVRPYLKIKAHEADLALELQAHIDRSKKELHVVGRKGMLPIPSDWLEHRTVLCRRIKEERQQAIA